MADLNSDGHLDIVYGAYWFAGPDFVPRTFRPNHVVEGLHARQQRPRLRRRQGRLAGHHRRRLGRGRHLLVQEPRQRRRGARARPGRCTCPGRRTCWPRRAATWRCSRCTTSTATACPSCTRPATARRSRSRSGASTKGADGAPALTPFVLGAEGGGHGFAFGDVNGDGREDVLTEIGWYERPAGDPFAGPWKLHPETALAPPELPVRGQGPQPATAGSTSSSAAATTSACTGGSSRRRRPTARPSGRST